MKRSFTCALALVCSCSGALAVSANHTKAFDQLIARYAHRHGIPEALLHHVIARESGYNPTSSPGRFYGLMQITYSTARSMGYRGDPNGLLDPEINLTYGVPYLANAYKLAGGNEARTTGLYSGGYYKVAKQRKLLGALRTADSPSLVPKVQPAGTAQPTNASTK